MSAQPTLEPAGYVMLEDGPELEPEQLFRILNDCQRRLDRLEMAMGTLIDAYTDRHRQSTDPEELAFLDKLSMEMCNEWIQREAARTLLDQPE